MRLPDKTHDERLRSWVDGADDHPAFPIQNLPFGVFETPGGDRRIATAIGDFVFDFSRCSSMLPDGIGSAIGKSSLNALFALPPDARLSLRRALSRLLGDERHRHAVSPLLHRADEVRMAMPFDVGDYTDFYVGIHHAEEVGRQFRPENPLLPNYKWVPIGYHGRSSSLRISGTDVIRPSGQTKPAGADMPNTGPSRRLDFELELGVWIGGGNALGSPVDIADADDQFGGLCLLNDWSARDIQAWEYQPLGPFLSKSFHTSVSPWVITAEALIPFRIAQPARPANDPTPLPYLWNEHDQAHGAFSIELSVHLVTAAMRRDRVAPHRLAVGPATNMYWTVAQMITHHTSNGCSLMPGDLLGTGTISTADRTGKGSLLELSIGGTEPFRLENGETRTFLEDGDEVILSAVATAPGRRSIGFGECRARILGDASRKQAA